MNQHNKIILKAIDGLSEAINLVRALADAQTASGVYLKSAVPKYSYSYTHTIDLGQGRTRNIHLNFGFDPQTGELVLLGENVSDTDS
ncbi:hypothetical protein LAJ19_10715 [Deinococcus taeanensis]|uniref:hypothetical protein n=1 Tax=Deinococcus taeanensis TaxID=2737050 RepID=UPI001CDB48CD|nr:hypothetical protein [Deinococcus taeanensis]UBV42104.1 hypothetical protein LAJ19_10715 [Deinococcus taeanensis]